MVRWCDEVIVSLDGSRAVHDAIRRMPRAYDRLAEGVAVLKELDPAFRVTARCVIQCSNYADLPNIIQAAHDLRLDQVSFLAADVSTAAFNRPVPWDGGRVSEVALSAEEVAAFARVLEATIAARADDFASGFIAESPDKLRRLARYYAALNGDGDFPRYRATRPGCPPSSRRMARSGPASFTARSATSTSNPSTRSSTGRTRPHSGAASMSRPTPSAASVCAR
ncbi:MAG: hypothetical protein M5R40_17440 [Anaerolineae bacterium]|nr:hypothetical protein [Anaerolineae bacterium]